MVSLSGVSGSLSIKHLGVKVIVEKQTGCCLRRRDKRQNDFRSTSVHPKRDLGGGVFLERLEEETLKVGGKVFGF